MKKKTDHDTLSSEEHEIDYVAAKFKAPRKLVREVQKRLGVKRRVVYPELRRLGYEIVKKGDVETFPH